MAASFQSIFSRGAESSYESSEEQFSQPIEDKDKSLYSRNAAEEAKDNAAVVARLCAVLQNPLLADVIIVSERDGTQHPASRIILSSCSPVFSSMLLSGAYLESSKGTVSSIFSGETLAALISFAATNDAPVLWGGPTDLLVETLEASEYYAVDDLRFKAKCALLDHACEPSEACRALDVVWERWAAADFGRSLSGEIAQAAILTIDESHDVALLNCGCLCEAAMKIVLTSEKTGANEASLFEALCRWASADVDRRASVARLYPSLCFARMPPSFLRDVVAKSGFVPVETLYDAFQTQALTAEMSRGFPIHPRGPVWCSTNRLEYSCERSKHGVELLERSLETGKWSWSLKVLRLCSLFWVGVACGHVDKNEWLGKQRSGFAFGSNGASCHATGKDNGPYFMKGPGFKEGDELTLLLDCDHGDLSIRINGGEIYQAFSGMKRPEGAIAFRPAISLVAPGHVRLLSFEKLN